MYKYKSKTFLKITMYNIREYKGSCTCIISKTNNPPLSNGAR